MSKVNKNRDIPAFVILIPMRGNEFFICLLYFHKTKILIPMRGNEPIVVPFRTLA